MRNRFLRPVLALALFGAPSLLSLAAQAPVAASAERDWVAFLGAYPQPGSEALHRDLAILLWLQGTRTQADLLRAEGEVILQPGAFSLAAGVDLESSRFPLTRALLAAADQDLRAVTSALKLHFARPRPFEADARIKPGVPLERSFSYPSGHGTRGVVEAGVLADLVPSHREAILERGRQVGNDRVMGGVHYPSDVEAGQRLGAALVEAWLQDPARRRQVEAARAAEWSK